MNPVRALLAGLLLVAAVSSARPARAALTSSEQAQVKGFIAGAEPRNATRVRALVARPDLSAEESASILTDSLIGVPFSDQRAAFIRELLLGGPSVSARSVLVVAGTRAMLARADALLSKHAADVDNRPDILAELWRIYALIGGEIAGAGHPQGLVHDPQAGIAAAAYDDCAKALSEHVQRNPRWLKATAPVAQAAAHVRNQALLALYEMMNDSPTRKVDAADRLGLMGPRRAFLTELGILLLDGGSADDARVGRVRRWVDRMPEARVGLEALVFGDSRALLRARGPILSVDVPLETPEAQVESDEVEPAAVDLPLFVLAYELSRAEVQRVLDSRGELRLQAVRDLGPSGSAGSAAAPAAMSLEQQLAVLVAQLMVDAPRTLDLAFGRLLGQRYELAAMVSDALGVLAAFAPTGDPSAGLVLAVGRPKGPDGDVEPLPVSRVSLGPTGAVRSFSLSGHKWEVVRGAAGAVEGVRRDGAPVSLAMLPTARVPLTDGASWSSGGVVFAKLCGAPRAGVAPGPRVRLVGTGERGFDSIVTPAPADDVVVETELSVHGQGGGVVVRASSGNEIFSGASLLIVPGVRGKVLLRASDGKTEADLATPVPLPAATSYKVKLTLKGNKLDANVNDLLVHASLPASLAHGDVALRAQRGATVEARTFSVKRP